MTDLEVIDIIDHRDDGHLFNPDLFVDGTDCYQRARFLAGAFIASYSNEHTRRGHAQVVREWIDWLAVYAYGVPPVSDHIRRAHIELYMRWLEDKGRTAATVARKVSVLAAFYLYLQGEDFITKNPLLTVRRPKVPKESTRPYLEPRELADFVNLAEREATTRAGRTAYVLACLLGLNGLRISEATGADVEDLRLERWHHMLKVTRKGPKVELVPLPLRTRYALDAALDGRETGPLLVNRRGNRMTRVSAGVIVKRLAETVAPGKNVTPHGIRHAAITALLWHGADIVEAQEFAGHADTRTTMIYDRRSKSPDGHGAFKVSNALASYPVATR